MNRAKLLHKENLLSLLITLDMKDSQAIQVGGLDNNIKNSRLGFEV